MSIILFITVLFVLIMVHELGHFLTAKWSKMKVEEFAIGFPPRLFSWKRGETVFSLNLLPIGGFVKILGENGEEEVSEKDKARSFASRPRYQQAIVLVAGVTMNILVAWLIFFAVAMIGQPAVAEEGDRTAELTVIAIAEGSPAEEAGVPLGAVLETASTATESTDLHAPGDLSSFTSSHQEELITITYTHKGESFTKEMMPARNVAQDDPNRAVIGISSVAATTVRENPAEAIVSATKITAKTLAAITVGVLSLFGSIFAGSADLSQVAGPIGIAGLVGDAAEFGIVSLLVFTAMISLNLAVINLLPVPALDGGRLLFVAIEAIIRKPVNPIWMGRVNLLGFSLLILLMIAVTFSDIVKII